jgi:UV DNA damage repair endonuclease
LSSEMFPFASHEEYGYTLEGFAKEVLGEVGKVAAEIGCRLTTHPGQVSSGVSGCAVVDRYKLIEILIGGRRCVVYATRIATTTGHR